MNILYNQNSKKEMMQLLSLSDQVMQLMEEVNKLKEEK